MSASCLPLSPERGLPIIGAGSFSGRTPIVLTAPEEVVADGSSLDRDILAGAHQFVAALLTFFDEDEATIDKVPTLSTDRVENFDRVLGLPRRGATHHCDDDGCLVHEVR